MKQLCRHQRSRSRSGEAAPPPTKKKKKKKFIYLFFVVVVCPLALFHYINVVHLFLCFLLRLNVSHCIVLM